MCVSQKRGVRAEPKPIEKQSRKLQGGGGGGKGQTAKYLISRDFLKISVYSVKYIEAEVEMKL